MKRKRFSVEQNLAAVKQPNLGVLATDIVRGLGIAEQTLCRWKKRYGGLVCRPHRSLKELSPQQFKALWVQRTSEIH